MNEKSLFTQANQDIPSSSIIIESPTEPHIERAMPSIGDSAAESSTALVAFQTDSTLLPAQIPNKSAVSPKSTISQDQFPASNKKPPKSTKKTKAKLSEIEAANENVNQIKRQPSSLASFVVQCSLCYKWRNIPTIEEYETIRANLSKDPFTCNRAKAWRPSVSCDDPTDITNDGSSVWAKDREDIPKPPKGWRRRIVVRGTNSNKFSDVYYYSPCGKSLRSLNDVDRFLLEHPEYIQQGISRKEFSFWSPKPYPVTDSNNSPNKHNLKLIENNGGVVHDEENQLIKRHRAESPQEQRNPLIPINGSALSFHDNETSPLHRHKDQPNSSKVARSPPANEKIKDNLVQEENQPSIASAPNSDLGNNSSSETDKAITADRTATMDSISHKSDKVVSNEILQPMAKDPQ